MSLDPGPFNRQGAHSIWQSYGSSRLMIAGTLYCLISTMTTNVCKESYQYILSQGTILFGLGVGLQVPFHPRSHFLLLPGCNECRWSSRSNTITLLSPPFNPLVPTAIPPWTFVSHLLVICKIPRLCNAVFCFLQIFFEVFRIGR